MALPTPPKRCGLCGRTYSADEKFCSADGQRLVAEELGDPWVGRLVAGRFRILELIGKGGMGVVYRAIQEPVERPVAIKLLHPERGPDPRLKARFLREARAISRLTSPHTVTLYDFGEVDEDLYIAMELLEGRTLSRRVRDDGPLSVAEAVHVVSGIAASVAEAHAAGLVHRDLKPENVFLATTHGDDAFVKVLDFGLAAPTIPTGDRLTTEEAVPGTPSYMAPERIQGNGCDPSSDVYSIGVIFFQILTGRRLFKGRTSAEIMTAHLRSEPPRLSDVRPELDVPDELVALIWRCLAKHPALRPADAGELARQLDLISGVTANMSAVPEPETTYKAIRRRPHDDNEETRDATPRAAARITRGLPPEGEPSNDCDSFFKPLTELELESESAPPPDRKTALRVGGAFAAAAIVVALAQLALGGFAAESDAESAKELTGSAPLESAAAVGAVVPAPEKLPLPPAATPAPRVDLDLTARKAEHVDRGVQKPPSPPAADESPEVEAAADPSAKKVKRPSRDRRSQKAPRRRVRSHAPAKKAVTLRPAAVPAAEPKRAKTPPKKPAGRSAPARIRSLLERYPPPR